MENEQPVNPQSGREVEGCSFIRMTLESRTLRKRKDLQLSNSYLLIKCQMMVDKVILRFHFYGYFLLLRKFNP